MRLDILLSAALAVCTIIMAYLGVHVTMHPPNESRRVQFWYKAGFCICGICAVCLVVWQGVRNGRTQLAAGQQIGSLRDDVRTAKSEAQNARHDLENESTRRKQAERDLAIIVQATGKSTRDGVVSDIKKSPIKVQVEGLQADASAPVLVGVRFTEARIPSTNPEAPYGKQVTIQTDRRIEPVAMIIKCNGPISSGSANAGNGTYTNVTTGPVAGDATMFLIAWQSPAFLPETPIIATLFSKENVKVVSVELISWSQVRH